LINPDRPYLSLVIAARNDSYGGNFLRRFQMFFHSVQRLLTSPDPFAELVIVEWNPPPDSPRLSEVIAVPTGIPAGRVRMVEVPWQVHRNLPNSDKFGLYEYLAKNVGVRRARGDFVLITNPDIVFSNQLVDALLSRSLLDSAFYRADRFDFAPPPSGWPASLDVFWAQVRAHTVHKRWEDRLTPASVHIPVLRRLVSMMRSTWPSTGTSQKLNGRGGFGRLDDGVGPYGGAHANAAGDFLLASCAAWARIRGFPEFTDMFTHLDGYAVHNFLAAGYVQYVAVPPAMIFHADHDRSKQESLPVRDSWVRDLELVREGQAPRHQNPADWGLAGCGLEEHVPGASFARAV
jgi:hypothetical protein